MLFDTFLAILIAVIVARDLFAKQGRIGISLVAIVLSALLTASLTPYYVTFLRLPNQGMATVVYYILTYLLLYVFIAVPAIILSSLVKILIAALLLGFIVHLLPVSWSATLVKKSRIYPLMGSLFAFLPPLDATALGTWLRNLLPGSH